MNRTTPKIEDSLGSVYEELVKGLETNDAEYAQAFEVMIEEMDAQVRSYLKALKAVTDRRLEEVSSALDSKLESSRASIDSVGREVKSAKSDMNRLIREMESSFSDSSAKAEVKISSLSKEFSARLSEFRSAMDSARGEMISRITGHGGGNASRRLTVDGAELSTKYMDANFVSGTNVTIAKTDDTTSKRANITISATGGGGSLSVLNATGTIDDSNTAFTYLSKPTLVCVNGTLFRENSGWTWTSGTLTATLSGPVGTGGFTYGLS